MASKKKYYTSLVSIFKTRIEKRFISQFYLLYFFMSSPSSNCTISVDLLENSQEKSTQSRNHHCPPKVKELTGPVSFWFFRELFFFCVIQKAGRRSEFFLINCVKRTEISERKKQRWGAKNNGQIQFGGWWISIRLNRFHRMVW